MSSSPLVLAMIAHVVWSAVLYVALTIARAPSVWGIGRRSDGTNPFSKFEPHISANIKNQFEWPLLFYVVCLLLLTRPDPLEPIQIWLAWTFVAGRVLHSGVQTLTGNIRLRGVVFAINFVAVLGMWATLL